MAWKNVPVTRPRRPPAFKGEPPSLSISSTNGASLPADVSEA